jgi:arylsulfatase A
MTLAKATFGATAKPNIIFILADDMGWGDVSCNNPQSLLSTPNIDRIAKEGIRFTNAHAPSSVCTPTRYGLLTGRYPWRTPVRDGVLYQFCPALIRKGRMTLPSLLKAQGYATGGFGKWNLGIDWEPVPGDPGDWEFGTPIRRGSQRLLKRVEILKPFRSGPLDVGFDTYYGISDNIGYPYWNVTIEDRGVSPGTSEKNGLWSSPGFKREEIDDQFTARAIQFMEKNVSRPFFVYLPLTAPHGPLKPPPRLVGKSGECGPLGDMNLWVDDSVGRILQTLDRLKISDNTLIIFASDNGSVFNGDRKTWTPKTNHRPSGPYRGFKTDIWEGGTHIPFVARWPGKIPVGAINDHLFCLTDMLATIASIHGVPLPENAGEDSINQLAAVLGKAAKPVRDNLITYSYTGVHAIRQGPWKAIFDTEGSAGHQGVTPEWQPIIRGIPERPGSSGVGQLYNLAEDPYEKNNLWAMHPEIVAQLGELYRQQWEGGRSRPN